MSFVSQIELGLAEFASYEYAHEQGTMLAVTAFTAVGKGIAQFSAMSFADSGFSISNKSLVGFVSQAVAPANLNAQAKATSDLSGGVVIQPVFNINGQTYLAIDSGFKVGVTFASEGTSTADIRVLDGYVFAMGGNSHAIFHTGATVNAVLESKASSEFKLSNYTSIEAMFASLNSSNGVFPTQVIAESGYEGHGLSSMTINTQAIANLQLGSTGQTVLEFFSAARSAAGFSIGGTSALSLNADAVASTNMHVVGTAQMLVPANLISDSVMTGESVTKVVINPGSPVYLYMEPAWKEIIRPFENRTAEWKQ